jgi:hypothetical protein
MQRGVQNPRVSGTLWLIGNAGLIIVCRDMLNFTAIENAFV